jgi:outer membrane biosynthesis protein TonB
MAALATILLLAALRAQPGAAGPAIVSAPAPTIPMDAVEGGVVIDELTVDGRGAVDEVQPLRTTPPYDTGVHRAVKRWTFRPPGSTDSDAVAHVLVAAVFRPRTFPGVPMAQSKDTAVPTEDVPFPREIEPPPYPIDAVGDGMVVLEVRLSSRGRADQVRVLSGTAPFAQVSEDTVRRWDFRPARTEGSRTTSTAYVIFGFRAPTTTPSAAPDDFSSTGPIDTTASQP